jgi:hypothetical protein
MPLSRLVVALLTISFLTCAGDAAGTLCKYRAATPATCGAAIDVPLNVPAAGAQRSNFMNATASAAS